MTIYEKLLKQLNELSTDPPLEKQLISFKGKAVSGYRLNLKDNDGVTTLSLTVADIDRYSALFAGLHLTRTLSVSLTGSEPEACLHHLAESAIHRLRYLVEPLILVELDAQNNTAQLRSIPRQPRADERDYWELLIQLNEQASFNLARYHWSASLPERQFTPYPAIYTNLARLADDLAGVLNEAFA